MKIKVKTTECIRKYWKNYLLLFGLMLLGCAALLRANYYYVDDLGRAANGYKGWEYFSRYLSVWFSTVVHGDSYLADVAPLPQLLTLVILAVTGIIAIVTIARGRKITLWASVAAVPIALSPFYLECLSYRYDAPYIALSVFFSIVPACFINCKKRWIYPLSCLIATLGMCMTYQASSGIFPMLVLLLTFLQWRDEEKTKEILHFLGSSVVSYCAGLLIFKYLILTPVTTYVTTYQAPFNSLFSTIISNLKMYFQVILRDFKPIWLVLIGVICAIFPIIEAVTAPKRKKVASFFAALVTVLLMLLVSFGAYTLLESSFFNPRAMYGFGAFVALVSIEVAMSQKEYLGKAAIVALCWLFLVFANMYGNCLRVQAEYTDFRIQLLISDLNELPEFNNDNYKTVKFEGDIGYSQVIQNIPRENYTMLDDLLPVPFGGGNVINSTGFYYYYNIPNIVRYDFSTDLSNMDLPMLKDTVYHTIYGDGTNFRIVLK